MPGPARIDGHRVVITGATSGIGRATATELARRGGTITIVCRNPAKGETTATDIAIDSGGERPDIVALGEVDRENSGRHEGQSQKQDGITIHTDPGEARRRSPPD